MLCALNPEDLVPKDHPLREVKALADEALKRLDAQLDAMYAEHGRPSVPPEQLLKSMLLMALYSIRSDRMFHEQLQYDLPFKWFLDMDMDERVFDRTVFSHNRERLLQHDVARSLFGAVVEQVARSRFQGRRRTELSALFVATAYNLLRISRLPTTVEAT